jgi:hypothetical protein
MKRNPYHNKGMADYVAIHFYLEKNNHHYFTSSPNSKKAYQGSNQTPSPRHASGRYFQQALGLRLQRHQREANDDHSNST